MFNTETSSFLNIQIRRSTESGDTEQAMAQMRRFLELEREIRNSALTKATESFSNVRKLPVLKTV
jgi:hypothetical protein